MALNFRFATLPLDEPSQGTPAIAPFGTGFALAWVDDSSALCVAPFDPFAGVTPLDKATVSPHVVSTGPSSFVDMWSPDGKTVYLVYQTAPTAKTVGATLVMSTDLKEFTTLYPPQETSAPALAAPVSLTGTASRSALSVCDAKGNVTTLLPSASGTSWTLTQQSTLPGGPSLASPRLLCFPQPFTYNQQPFGNAAVLPSPTMGVLGLGVVFPSLWGTPQVFASAQLQPALSQCGAAAWSDSAGNTYLLVAFVPGKSPTPGTFTVAWLPESSLSTWNTASWAPGNGFTGGLAAATTLCAKPGASRIAILFTDASQSLQIAWLEPVE